MEKDKVKLNTAPSQTQRVSCQYCPAGSRPILVKNYKRHIEEKHKDKDSRNLKDRKTKSITLWTSSSKRKRDSNSEAIESQTIKRRHQSGDSGWGTGDDDEELETGDRDRVGGLESDRQEEEPDPATVQVDPGPKETAVLRQNESEEEDNVVVQAVGDPSLADTLSDETDKPLGLPPVHDPAAPLSDETDKPLGPPLVHDPAAPLSVKSPGPLLVHESVAALSDDEDDRETETGTSNDDILKMLCQLKLGQNKIELNVGRIQEGIDKIRLNPGSDAEESAGPLLVHDPAAALSEEASAVFSIVKSIKAFEKLDFVFDDEKECLRCNICETTFKYTGQHEFKDENLTQAFRNLKMHVKTHLLSQKHAHKVAEMQQEKERKKVFVSRNRKAGFNIGRIAYKNVRLRQAKRDFEIDILLTSRAGGEVGNVNHSSEFVRRLRPCLADAVRDFKRSYFSTPTLQTGCLPCFCCSFDGGTYKRECRHFQGKSLMKSSN